MKPMNVTNAITFQTTNCKCIYVWIIVLTMGLTNEMYTSTSLDGCQKQKK